jgi:hypothetical protein
MKRLTIINISAILLVAVLSADGSKLLPDTCVSIDAFWNEHKIGAPLRYIKTKSNKYSESEYSITRYTFISGQSSKDFSFKVFNGALIAADREARVYTQLHLENALSVLKYYGCMDIEKSIFQLVFEVWGDPFLEVEKTIHELVRDDRSLLFRLLADMTASVAELHAISIVHNNVSRGSFLYNIAGEKIEIKIIDFVHSLIGGDKTINKYFEYSGDEITEKISRLWYKKSQTLKDERDQLISRNDHFKGDIYSLADTLMELSHKKYIDYQTRCDLIKNMTSNDKLITFIGKNDLDYCSKKTNICLRHFFGQMFFARRLGQPVNAAHDMKTYAAGFGKKFRDIADNIISYEDLHKEKEISGENIISVNGIPQKTLI